MPTIDPYDIQVMHKVESGSYATFQSSGKALCVMVVLLIALPLVLVVLYSVTTGDNSLLRYILH